PGDVYRCHGVGAGACRWVLADQRLDLLLRLRRDDLVLFFFHDLATTEIYTLSLHDALPISSGYFMLYPPHGVRVAGEDRRPLRRSEEHTSELQSRGHLVCRLLLEKKNSSQTTSPTSARAMASRLAAFG